MNIEIEIKNKVAVAPEGVSIVCGNSDYTVSFNFDDEWTAETTRTARFSYRRAGVAYYKDVGFTGNIVSIPVLSGIHMVSIGVYAGNLRTTTPALIPCAPSILCVSATQDASDPTTWATLEQRIAALENYGEEFEGKVVYVKDGALAPLILGPGLEIRDGVLYLTGGGGEIIDTGITVQIDADGNLHLYNNNVEIEPEIDSVGDLSYAGVILRMDDNGDATFEKEA